jgi:hypothetical protein
MTLQPFLKFEKQMRIWTVIVTKCFTSTKMTIDLFMAPAAIALTKF